MTLELSADPVLWPMYGRAIIYIVSKYTHPFGEAHKFEYVQLFMKHQSVGFYVSRWGEYRPPSGVIAKYPDKEKRRHFHSYVTFITSLETNVYCTEGILLSFLRSVLPSSPKHSALSVWGYKKKRETITHPEVLYCQSWIWARRIDERISIV